MHKQKVTKKQLEEEKALKYNMFKSCFLSMHPEQRARNDNYRIRVANNFFIMEKDDDSFMTDVDYERWFGDDGFCPGIACSCMIDFIIKNELEKKTKEEIILLWKLENE